MKGLVPVIPFAHDGSKLPHSLTSMCFFSRRMCYTWEPGLTQRTSFLWQGRNIQGSIKGQLSESSVGLERDRSASLELVRVSVTVARLSQPKLWHFRASVLFSLKWMNLTEDLERPGALGQWAGSLLGSVTPNFFSAHKNSFWSTEAC